MKICAGVRSVRAPEPLAAFASLDRTERSSLRWAYRTARRDGLNPGTARMVLISTFITGWREGWNERGVLEQEAAS